MGVLIRTLYDYLSNTSSKEKVFLDFFWRHLHQKNWRDRGRRIRFLPAAIELLQYSHADPVSVQNPNNRSQILHRFYGKTSDGYVFVVQIKEEKRSGQKWLLSVFPANK